MQKKQFIGLTTGTALAIAAVFGATATANAATSYPGGGTWEYGIHEPSNAYYVFSNYHHPSQLHRSTACNKSACKRSANKSGGTWSYASILASGALFGTHNTAYWHVY